MSAKLIYVLSSFHMLFCAFSIHIIVKLIKFPLNWFCRIIDEKQVILQEMSNIFPKEESTGSLPACHWEDKFFCTIWNIKWFKFPHGCILHSNSFPMSTHTPKSELKRISYDPDNLEKKNKLLSRNCRNQASCHNKKKNCRNQETCSWSRPKMLEKTKKRPKIDISTYFQAHFTLGPCIYSFFR